MSSSCFERVFPRLHILGTHLQVSEARSDLLSMRIGMMERLRDYYGRVALVLSLVQQE